MKKVISVVTGANGFIGSHLILSLLDKKHLVKCIIRETSDLKWIEHLDVEFIKCGLNDLKSLSAAFGGATYVFHLAGMTRAKKYEDYIYGNVQLTEHVMKACEGHDSIKKILITSSLAAASPSPLNKPVVESVPSAPISMYGKSKLKMEQLLKEKYTHLPYVIIRPPVVYGIRDTEVLLFFKTVKKGLIPTIGLGKKQVSIVYIDDLIQGICLAAENDKAIRQTYFFESDRILEWEQIGRETAALLSCRAIKLAVPHFVVYLVAGLGELMSIFQKRAPTLNLEKAKELTQEAWTCSAEKAKKELGYQPKTSYKEGFRITLEWYQKEGWI
ncbi:MAG: dihydroflavonol-4-reductase [Maribacter sp.]|jgi:dihydroflavonol-4-reductase